MKLLPLLNPVSLPHIPILIILISLKQASSLLDLDLSLKLNLLGGKKSPPKPACLPPLPLLPFIIEPSPSSIVDNINPNKNTGGGAGGQSLADQNSGKPTNGNVAGSSSRGTTSTGQSGRPFGGETIEKPQLNRAPGRSSAAGNSRVGGFGRDRQMSKSVIHASDSRTDPVGTGLSGDQRFGYQTDQRGRRAGHTSMPQSTSFPGQSQFQFGVTNARQPAYQRGFGGTRRIVSKVSGNTARNFGSNTARRNNNSPTGVVPRGMSALIVSKADGNTMRNADRHRRGPTNEPTKFARKISEPRKRQAPIRISTTLKPIIKTIRGKLL